MVATRVVLYTTTNRMYYFPHHKSKWKVPVGTL
jgi:hypothetical protein